MKILFLDDDSARHVCFRKLHLDDDIRHVYEPWDAIEIMKHESFDLISLDHDLNFFEFTPYKTEITGTDVARWIADRVYNNMPEAVNFKNTHFHVHSWNTFGAGRMRQWLLDADLPVTVAVFGSGEVSATLQEIADFELEFKGRTAFMKKECPACFDITNTCDCFVGKMV